MEQFKFAGLDGADATLTTIHVKVGQEVKKDELLFEVEAEKNSEEIKAKSAGKIAKINFQPGDTIKVGDVVIEFGENDVKATSTVPETKTPKITAIDTVVPTMQPQPSNNNGKALATPLARKMAHDLGINLSTIKGTGPHGRVLKNDLLNAKTNVTDSSISSTNVPMTPQATCTSPTIGRNITAPNINVAKIESYGPVEHLPLTAIRKAIANTMAISVYTAPHVSLMIDVDGHNLVQLRASLKEEALKDINGPIKLTYLPFFIKAVAKTLKEDRFKLLNATLNWENNEILVKKYYHIGMAADTEKGLVVPVIKNADQLSLFEIARKVNELGNKAKTGTLKGEEMQGGTFTITNFGSAGLKFGTPVINYPEVAILGLGAMESRAVINNGEIVFHSFFPLSISIDHRVIDGAPAGYFMTRIKYLLENPALILA